MESNLKQNNIYIAGIGMLTALGGNAEMTAAAVKAGVSAYSLSEFTNKDDKPITMANVPRELFSSMQIEIERNNSYREQFDHIIKMAILALQNAYATSGYHSDVVDQAIPLILAMPEPQENVRQMPAKLFIKNIVKLSGLPLDEKKIHCIYSGRAAGIEVLDLARRYLFEQDQEYVLIGGSHSYINISLINELNNQQRLLSQTSKDGFAPGEGSGFLLLTRRADYALNKNNQIIKLHPEGIAEEEGHLGSDNPYLGNGLDQAFKKAFDGYKGKLVNRIFSSMNGESFWAKENGVAIIRNKSHLLNDFVVEHPVDCFGDLATATGAVLMGLSAINLLGRKELETHLVYCSSDGPQRAAILLEKVAFNSKEKGIV